jgi:hypothetical protein
MLVTLPSPIPELQHTSYPFKVLRVGSMLRAHNLSTIYYFRLTLSLSRSLGALRIHIFESAKNYERMSPHIPKWIRILGVGVLMESQIFIE